MFAFRNGAHGAGVSLRRQFQEKSYRSLRQIEPLGRHFRDRSLRTHWILPTWSRDFSGYSTRSPRNDLVSVEENVNRSDSILRVAKLAQPELPLILKSVATLGVTSSISLFIPSVCGQIIDMCLKDPTGVSPYYAAGGLLGLTAVAGAGVVLRSRWLAVAGNRIVARMRQQLFDAIARQDIAYFDRVPTGDLVTRLAADTQMIQRAATNQVVAGMRSIVMGVGGTACLMYTSWPLALVSLGTLPPILLAAQYFGRTIRDRQKRVQELLSESTSLAEETFGNIRTVRQFAAETHESKRYGTKIEETYDEAVRAGMAQAWFDGIVHVAANGAILGVLGYGGSMVLDQAISAGDLASFLLYTMLVAANVSSLSSTYAEAMKAIGASGRVFAIIDRVPDMPSIMDPGHRGTSIDSGALGSSPLSINFEDVTFAYPLRPDLNVLGPHFSLSVRPGEVLAIVGGSGSGKSTIAGLLTRLYDLDNDTIGSGAVLVDGTDIRLLDPRSLRESIGIVAQEPVLFAATIEENIRYGRLGATDEEVRQAAAAARVLEFSDKFPDGLQTEVGQRGTQLSGGQKQRVAVARAILKDPPIVVFDEATSALDAESEHYVQMAINTVMEGRTVISIAHRLSTIREADRIAVLQGGIIVETGSFDELIEKENGVFQELMARQLS
jgi:ATP-binding cassette subfamily B protein